jgi:hypothetical protein
MKNSFGALRLSLLKAEHPEIFNAHIDYYFFFSVDRKTPRFCYENIFDSANKKFLFTKNKYNVSDDGFLIDYILSEVNCVPYKKIKKHNLFSAEHNLFLLENFT